MSTLAEILASKLQAAKDEVTKIETDIASLNPSGWLQRDESELKSWIQAAMKHLGL